MTTDAFVVVVANRKGGTGKTTTAVNLAAHWAKQGHQTLLIDLDTQGHVAVGLGMAHLNNQDTIHHLLREPQAGIMSCVKPTLVDKLSLIAADTHLMHGEPDILALQHLLKTAHPYARIIIDTPPSLDSLLLNGLAAANMVLTPFVPDYLAQIGVEQLAALFYQVASRYNPDLHWLYLLPVMKDRRKKLQQRVLAQLAKQFGKKRLLRGIRNNIKLAEAFEQGCPVHAYAPKCAGNMDYWLLAQQIETLILS